MPSKTHKLSLAFMTFALTVGLATAAFGQSNSSDASVTDAAASNAASTPSSKAQRKAARKQARAKKNAELKKLEGAGYQPSQNGEKYPQDIENAQKKAGIGTAASQ